MDEKIVGLLEQILSEIKISNNLARQTLDYWKSLESEVQDNSYQKILEHERPDLFKK